MLMRLIIEKKTHQQQLRKQCFEHGRFNLNIIYFFSARATVEENSKPC